MIKIKRIEPINDSTGRIPIRNLRKEYYDHLNQKGKHKINNILRNAITRDALQGYLLNQDQKDLLQFLVENFERILLGDVNTLNKIKTDIENKKWQQLVYKNERTTTFGKKLITVFGYTNRFRSNQDRGIWLAKQLNIKTCPYCNAQYTLLVQPKDKEDIAKFQFDHFFAKEQYPYFSVSLYNLIPSCASCNHKKSNKDFSITKNYHPYYNSLATLAKFKLEYPYEPDKLSFDAIRKMSYNKELKIRFIPKYSEAIDLVNEHNETFDIESIYERHKDHAYELLLKSIIFDIHYQESIKAIQGLFPDKITMMHYLLGNYLNEDEILKRPLAKFYQDIARQLNLID